MIDGATMRELVTAARHGDGRALDTLIREVITPTARRTCLALNGGRWSRDSAVDVDDLAQTAVIATVQALPRLDGPELPAFVRAVARHKVYEVFRTDTRNRSAPVCDFPEFADPAPQPDEAAERAAELVAASGVLKELLAGLTPRMRAVLVMRIGHELPSADVAAALGTTPTAVRVTQHRALAAVRRRLSRIGVAA